MSLPFVEQFAAEPAALRTLRQHVRRELGSQRLAENDAEMVLLVVDELVSNAIEHGRAYRADGKPLRVGLFVDGADLVLEFVDRDMPRAEIAELGRSLAGGVGGIPDIEDERGRGLFLVTAALEGIVVEDRTAAAEGMLLRGRFAGMGAA